MTDQEPGAAAGGASEPTASAQPEGADQGGAGQKDAMADIRLLVHRHYIKDLSVENPNAPEIFTKREQPQVKVQLDVNASRLQERIFEVVLACKVDATVEDKAAFIVELDFAALIKVGDKVADSEMESILAVEVPQLLFPFARNIIADVTRDGGYPPLLVNPVDFASLRRQKVAAAQAAQQDQAAAEAE